MIVGTTTLMVISNVEEKNLLHVEK
jgi:hypothetical protein